MPTWSVHPPLLSVVHDACDSLANVCFPCVYVLLCVFAIIVYFTRTSSVLYISSVLLVVALRVHGRTNESYKRLAFILWKNRPGPLYLIPGTVLCLGGGCSEPPAKCPQWVPKQSCNMV